MKDQKTMENEPRKRKVLTIYVDELISLKFKARAAIEGKSMTSIIRELIHSYVNPT